MNTNSLIWTISEYYHIFLTIYDYETSEYRNKFSTIM